MTERVKAKLIKRRYTLKFVKFFFNLTSKTTKIASLENDNSGSGFQIQTTEQNRMTPKVGCLLVNERREKCKRKKKGGDSRKRSLSFCAGKILRSEEREGE